MQHTYIDFHFQVIDDDKYAFLTTPRICKESAPFIVVIILSMAVNVEQRLAIRRVILPQYQNINGSGNHMLGTPGKKYQYCLDHALPTQHFSAVKPLFLIGGNEGGLPEVKDQLQMEIQEHQDILLSSRKEEYHKTAYKILGAYIWVQWYRNIRLIDESYFQIFQKPFSFCPDAKFILKTDDNAVLNYNLLVDSLQEKYFFGSLPDGVVECPNPIRNSRPIIPPTIGGRHTVHGKWGTHWQVLMQI